MEIKVVVELGTTTLDILRSIFQPTILEVEAPKRKSNAKVEAKPVEVPELQGPAVTVEILRKTVGDKTRNKPELKPVIKEILGRYGAPNITELAEEHYAAVLKEVEAI